MKYKVIKIGGSIISPQNSLVDESLIKKFAAVVNNYTKSATENSSDGNKARLILVIGGGNTSRYYRDVAVSCDESEDEDLHKIGIAATWLNAELIRSLVSTNAYPFVLGVGVYADDRKEGEKRISRHLNRWLRSDRRVLVCGGFINNASTDFNAMLLASKIGLQRVYKLSNVDFIYDKDPRKFDNAQPIKNLTWKQYLSLVSEGVTDVKDLEHKPGAHFPVTLLAARFGMENNLECVMSGGSVENLEKILYSPDTLQGTLLRG